MKKISLSGSLTHVMLVIILLVSLIGTGFKKSTQEEIMAGEQATQARLQAEAQARAAEEAKQKEEEAAFAIKAKRYRELPVKPALPEDVQRYRVMAEDAFKNKDFDKALEYYRKGLAIEPLWLQGQFNAAQLAGELHSYKWAALYMKHYLELVPNAANAKTAREKMYLWDGKAEEVRVASADESKGYFGIAAQEITAEISRQLGIQHDAGVIVTDVENGSPADEVGIQSQDIIVQVNKVKVASIKEYNKEMKKAADKKSVVLLIKRGKSTFFVSLLS